ncbi:MAG: nucleotide-binding universal stress UspA family protein [Flavobacteriales bacterium]|jgi:nucleotide-binding universal stress UspA family protein
MNEIYNTIATGLAFSPRMEANLCESIRLASYFDADLVLIHVGESSAKKTELLNSLLKKHPFNSSRLKVVWHKGDPVEVILRACKVHKVDLLLAGAVANEGLLTYYMGSVARKLSRQAKCSLLLLLEPSVQSKKFHSMVVSGNEDPDLKQTLLKSFEFARGIGVDKVTIVEELSPKTIKMNVEDEASAKQASIIQTGFHQRETERVQKILDTIKCDQLDIHNQCIFGKKGYTIGHYAQSTHVDLLVISSPKKKYGLFDRFFTNDLEYILSDMPTNLLIINHKNNG